MIQRLHHVGLVVPDIRAAMARYSGLPGVTIGESFELPERHYLLAYVYVGNCLIELTQPVTSDSVAGRFLTANPNGGLNHLAFEVADLRSAQDSFLAQGAVVMGSDEPRQDRSGTLVLVLDAARSHGTLVELRQRVS